MAHGRARLTQLLSRAAAGDRDSFAEFYDLTVTDAYKVARVCVPEGRGAEDVVREAYVDAWRDICAYSSAELSPRAWILSRVRRNVAAS